MKIVRRSDTNEKVIAQEFCKVYGEYPKTAIALLEKSKNIVLEENGNCLQLAAFVGTIDNSLAQVNKKIMLRRLASMNKLSQQINLKNILKTIVIVQFVVILVLLFYGSK